MKFQVREFQRAAKRHGVLLRPGITFLNGGACVVGIALLVEGIVANRWDYSPGDRDRLREKIGDRQADKLLFIERGFEGAPIGKRVYGEPVGVLSKHERRLYHNIGKRLRKVAVK